MTARDAYARRHTAIERVIWGLILGAPLLVLAFMAVSALTRHAPPVRTGDALLDAFLQQLVDRDELATPELASCYLHYGGAYHVSDAVFEALEPTYSSDPRFWMLCYWLRTPTKDPHWKPRALAALGGPYDPAGYLEEAHRRGIADAPVLLHLLHSRELDWSSLAWSQHGSAPPGRKAGAAQGYAFRTSIRKDIDSEHRQDEEQLLADLMAVAPDQALSHFWVAKLACERGDLRLAASELHKCNTVSRFDTTGFPGEIAGSALLHRKPLKDSLILGWLAVQGKSMLYLMDTTDFARDMAYLSVQHRNGAALDELHRFVCTIAAQEGANASLAELTARLASDVRDEVQRGWPGGLSASQQTKLQELDSKINSLQAACTAISTSGNQGYAALTGTAPATMLAIARQVCEQLCDRATGGRSETVPFLIAAGTDESASERAVQQQVQPLFDDIAKFSYAEALKP